MALRQKQKLQVQVLQIFVHLVIVNFELVKTSQKKAEVVRPSSAYQAAFSRADEASKALRLLGTLDATARLAESTVCTQSADAENSTSGDALDNKIVFTELEEFVWCLRSKEDKTIVASEEIKDETGGWAEILEPCKTENKEEIVRDDNIYEAPAGKGLSGALKLLKETVEQADRSTLINIHGDEGAKEINLDRRDEFGRVVTPKEAYRLFCHEFHGKGPGKRKRERRINQYQDELKLKQITSSNVLPQSVDRMRETLSQSKSPYILFSVSMLGHDR